MVEVRGCHRAHSMRRNDNSQRANSLRVFCSTGGGGSTLGTNGSGEGGSSGADGASSGTDVGGLGALNWEAVTTIPAAAGQGGSVGVSPTTGGNAGLVIWSYSAAACSL